MFSQNFIKSVLSCVLTGLITAKDTPALMSPPAKNTYARIQSLDRQYTNNQGSRVSWLAQTAFAAYVMRQIGSQLLLSSTSSNALLGRGSEKAFDEYLGVSNVFPPAA